MVSPPVAAVGRRVRSRSVPRRTWYLLAVLTLLGSGCRTPEPDQDDLASGRRLYADGMLQSGHPLRAVGGGGVALEGAAAACTGCHRGSGLGSKEGGTVVAPLTRPGLFTGQEAIDGARSRPAIAEHAPYTDETFARALKEGLTPDGRTLDALMPRYDLDHRSIVALRTYLTALAAEPLSGVDHKNVHFATVLTPDADPTVRRATIEVLRAYVASRNASNRSPAVRRRAAGDPRQAARRRWALHIWKLSGPADAWTAQLEQRHRERPVFALVSGAGRDWRPVHAFCEMHRVPCLFPNVDVPGDARPGQYALYLSAGMLTEAAVMARYLETLGGDLPVVQVRRDDPRAAAAAAAFDDARHALGAPPARQVVLAPGEAPEGAVATGLEDPVLVLWLGAGDLTWLVESPSKRAPILASGSLLGAAAHDVTGSLAERLLVAWPYELPGKTPRATDPTRGWLRARGLDEYDERSALNTYLAAAVLNEGIVHLVGSFSGDYLVERVEHEAERSAATGVYPRLSLGPGQRFASKGAYLVRPQDGALVKVVDWTVP